MRGSSNFCHGEGWGVQEKHSDNVFLYISFLQRGPIVYFEENYNFVRFQRGSTFSRGGGGSKFYQGVWGPNANFYRNL